MNKTRAAVQMDSLFDIYNKTGINNLFCFNTLTGENSFGWDYLQMLIDKGHKKGILIHPVFYPCYDFDLKKDLFIEPEWLIRDMEGNSLPFLNLANPEVRKYWVSKVNDALKYDIDGIHLDYIRFPITQMYSYDSLTCEAFKKEFDYSPLEVSHDCGSMIWCEWIKWNALQVTTLVSEIRQAITASHKNVMLGVDVFPDFETAKVLIAQDWGNWGLSGLVDFICPMTYTNNLKLFRKFTQNALNNVKGKCMIYPGIGVSSSHNRLTKELLVKEVQITRDLGTEGMAFFSGYSFTKEFSDTLNASLFRQN